LCLLFLDAFLSAADSHVMPLLLAAGTQHIGCCWMDFRDL